MLERATRLWRMSPTMTTFLPSTLPVWRRMVKRSSSACVGWAWVPSPPLMMLALVCAAAR